MTLLYSKPGVPMVVDEITWSPGVKRRLEDMGFIKGTPVCVVRSDGFGAIVVEIKGSKLLLGRGMAQKIKVKQAA
jgi:Fe2+ transport system protein FeoA